MHARVKQQMEDVKTEKTAGENHNFDLAFLKTVVFSLVYHHNTKRYHYQVSIVTRGIEYQTILWYHGTIPWTRPMRIKSTVNLLSAP
jgi:hypothetical protein